MKIMFVHDHRFIRYQDKIYSPGKLPYFVWERYLKVFDHVLVCSRQLMDTKDIASASISSGSNVQFAFIPSISSPLSLIKNYRHAKSLLLSFMNDCDGIIARLPSELGLLAINIAKAKKKPFAIEVVGCAWDSYWTYSSFLGKIVAPVAFIRTRKSVREAKFALYVTKYFLQSRYPNRSRTCVCSNVEISEPQIIYLLNRVNFINEQKKNYVIGLIGYLGSSRKGIDTAISAINILKDKIPGIKLHIVGEGNKLKWLKFAKTLGVEKFVEFKGVLNPGNEIMNWLDNVDVYIQPSLGEGLPRAIIEAMSRGCPVIASKVAGIPELLEDEYMHNPKDSDSLSNMIFQFYRDKSLALKAAKLNFEKAFDYSSFVLDNRRTEFWLDFKNYINNSTKNI